MKRKSDSLSKKWKNPLFSLGFILIMASISHFLFSHLGFNPTDDGFILSGSRRIFDGQIPHRDFISIRPAGSYIFHSIFFLFNRDSIIWVTRFFVWFQFATIAWIWTIIISNSLNVFFGWWQKFAASIIVFTFTVHCYPIHVFHAIDALFFTSIGLFFCYRDYKYNVFKIIGYFLIGMTPLFRQNFLLLVPVSIILLNDWRKLRYWITSLIPIAAYIIYLSINHALSDFILQISTYSYKVSIVTGLFKFLINSGTPWGMIFGLIIILMIKQKLSFKPYIKNTKNISLLGILFLFIIPVSTLIILVLKGFSYISYPSFAVFGVLLSVILYDIYDSMKLTPFLRIGIIILFIAWSSSISLGFNSPALFMGPMVLVLIAVPFSQYNSVFEKRTLNARNNHEKDTQTNKKLRLVLNYVFICLFIISITSFVYVRRTHIYRDLSASHLNYNLDEILIGGKNIRTNKSTYEALMDLNLVISKVKAKNKEYVVIPDFAVHWINSTQQNPISIDWPQNTELGNMKLVERIIGELEKKRESIIIIVQRFEANSLAEGIIPFRKDYIIVEYVRENFDKIGETGYFELYK